MHIPEPRSILVIRLSALGDVAMASPLIPVLRRRYPRAHIAWLVQPEARGLLAANAALDEVIVWPRGQWRVWGRQGRWLALGSAAWRFARELRRRRFELVLDAQGLLKSGIWAWLSGAPARVGLGSREGSARLMTRVVQTTPHAPRIGSEYLELAQALGLEPGEFRMSVALSQADRQWARTWIAENALEAGYAAFAPFTTRPQKHWTEASWAELTRRVYGELGLVAVLLGGPGDRAAAGRIVDHAGSKSALNMAGQTSIGQAAALVAQARLLIGVDTGLTHLGPAFDIPSVAVFGSTRPYLDTARARCRVLYLNLICAPCQRNPICGGAYTCMTAISPQMVMARAREALAP